MKTKVKLQKDGCLVIMQVITKEGSTKFIPNKELGINANDNKNIRAEKIIEYFGLDAEYYFF